MLVAASALPAAACSIGRPDRFLEDETSAFYGADVVFLAQIVSYESVPPQPGLKQWTQRSGYRLIETYRGRPPMSGEIATYDAFKPDLDGQPPQPCSTWLLGPGLVGHTAIVFANKVKLADGSSVLFTGWMSEPVDDSDASAQKQQRLRLYHNFESQP
ncbi:hypothetical protein [Xanthomonas translucens]